MSSTPAIRWLHISDLHFQATVKYDADVVTAALLNSMQSLSSRFGKIDLVFVTGDIANSGKPAEYDRATEFFDRLLHVLGLSRAHLFVVPGNHDVDRVAGQGLARTLESREAADTYFDPNRALLHITHRQRAFADWYNQYFSGTRTFSENSTCSPVRLLTVGGMSVALLEVNSAAFSLDDSDHGKLWIGRRCVQAATRDMQAQSADLKVAIMHHPLEWICEIEHSNVKSSLSSSVDCILSGHLHRTDAELVAGLHGTVLHLVAGATYQTRKFPNRAMIVVADKAKLTITPLRYEDEPTEVWTLDTSIFPDEPDFQESVLIQRYLAEPIDALPIKVDSAGSSNSSAVSNVDTARADFRANLFVTPDGDTLYVEPRLMTGPQEVWLEEKQKAEAIPLSTVVSSSESYLVLAGSEYGGTTLCKRLAYEFAVAGIDRVFRKDARALPNYRKKLEAEFPREALAPGSSILILDNLDIERDERLLRELSQAGWFARVIAISVKREFRATAQPEAQNLPFDFKAAFLWGIHRSDVRDLASSLFKSSDGPFISEVVEKVYNDLLGLCIPLTPSNVIMYLRILYREGEFHPLNRVDILGRYVAEVLRKPSDAYRDTFNSKNKIDVLSAFTSKLYKEERNEFDERYWHSFVGAYQADTLTEFDGRLFLDELLDARIFSKSGSSIFHRYRFFFVFFLGRYIAARPNVLSQFLMDREYLGLGDLVDAITGLSSQNTQIVEHLTETLEGYLGAFEEKYLGQDFDPVGNIRWPDSKFEEEEVWKPIAAQINTAPKNPKEIDILKSSLIAEARTANQQVYFEKFLALENALFRTAKLLADALKNADDISGALKLRAVDCLLREHLVTYQIGTVFTPVITRQRLFRWGGVTFFNMDYVPGKEIENTQQARWGAVTMISGSVSKHLGDMIGTRKLGAVFRAKSESQPNVEFLDMELFDCILSARASGWDSALAKIIERTDKNAYYLYGMLASLTRNIGDEILSASDREKIKRLVAIIRAKRNWKKQVIGSKAVDRMLEHLEKNDYFSKRDPH